MLGPEGAVQTMQTGQEECSGKELCTDASRPNDVPPQEPSGREGDQVLYDGRFPPQIAKSGRHLGFEVRGRGERHARNRQHLPTGPRGSPSVLHNRSQKKQERCELPGNRKNSQQGQAGRIQKKYDAGKAGEGENSPSRKPSTEMAWPMLSL